MRTAARIIVVLTLLSGAGGRAFAQSAEEVLIKQSVLAVSAFQCAVVANDPKQHERLFTLGLKNGRDFIETSKKKPELYAKVHSRVPILWNLTSGPTTDFILGRVYAALEAEIYKEWTSDEALWTVIEDNMFREKNCALLQ